MNEFESFDDLREWLNKKKQAVGTPSSICSATNGPYTEIYAAHLSRPGDESFAEKMVASDIGRQISRLINRDSIIYWRIPLETRVEDSPQIIEYREDGPDKDFMTDRNCIKDHNWKCVKAYCRFAVGTVAKGVA